MNTGKNSSEAEIERILRTPSKFAPPSGLKEKLVGQVQMPGSKTGTRTSIATPGSGGWLRRWWPALAPAAVSVACAVVLTVQQGEIRDLKASNEALSQAAAAAQSNAGQRNDAVNTTPVDSSADMQHEIDRLRALAAQLKGEVGELQQLKTENTALRAQVATPPGLALTPQETEELGKAKEKAVSIACINNLKQFGLAVRVWALDNGDTNPPTILSMSNELSTPKILVCQADTTRQSADGWASFTTANCSYEYLAPNENTDADPQRVLSRCPIHGHIGLADGSVQSFVAKNHPDWLVERNGKLYLQSPPPAAQGTPNGNTVTLFGGPGAVWNSLFITNHAGLPLQCSACHSGQPGPGSYGLTVPTISELGTGASLTGVQMQQLKIFAEQYRRPGGTPVESKPAAPAGGLTPEQLKAFQERYGLVPTDGTAPQQQP